MNQIKLENLSVSIGNKKILNKINIEINRGDVIALVGPNGHGKSTLLKAIAKHYQIEINSGKILIDGKNTNNLLPNEVANLGLFLAPQISEEIPGVLMIDFLKASLNARYNKKFTLPELFSIINPILKNLEMDSSFLHRFVNYGFSGGEKKRSEILQMKLLNPDFVFLDEIDSGLDVDSLKIIIGEIKKWIGPDKALVIVSHNEKIFKEIKPTKSYLILNGSIAETGDFHLVDKIAKEGYEWVKKNYAKSI